MAWERITPQGRANARRGKQLGYAKITTGFRYEKVASDLARLVGAPVPRVEIVDLRPHGLCAISHVHSEASYQFRRKGYMRPANPARDPRLEAMGRKACGLLPFLAWIAAPDHFDESNLVVDAMSQGKLRLRAVDFDEAFKWADIGREQMLGFHQVLRENADVSQIGDVLRAIMSASDGELATCCNVLPSGEADAMVQKLVARKAELPPAGEFARDARQPIRARTRHHARHRQNPRQLTSSEQAFNFVAQTH